MLKLKVTDHLGLQCCIYYDKMLSPPTLVSEYCRPNFDSINQHFSATNWDEAFALYHFVDVSFTLVSFTL